MTPCFNTYNQQEKSMDLKDSYIYEFIKERNIGDISLKSCKKGSVITDGADDRIHVIFLLEGAIKVVTTSIEGKQKEDLDTRMKAVEERLYKQFNAMDSLVAQLMSTSDSLTQLFDSMPGFVTQKK